MLLKSLGITGTSALLATASRPGAVGQSRLSGKKPLAEPKVFFRDDGRHAAGIDQFEPPLEHAEVTLSVDQLIGSGVDTLLFSAGVEGGMVIYQSRVAQKLGDNVVKWTHPVHYRDARHLRQLITDGHDRLKVLCDRCHENGIWFVASLCIDIGAYSPRGHGRTSDFVFNHPELQVGKDDDPRAGHLPATRLNFLHPEVRKERFLIMEELLSNYETDGVEIRAGFPPLCKLSEVEQLTPVLTQWLRDLRAVAQRAERAQRRRKRIFFHIPANAETWRQSGYDVATWVSASLVDGLICASNLPETHDQDLDLSRTVQLTRGTSCRVMAACHSGLSRESAKKATPPMIWAAAANAYDQGADGFGLDDPHWFSWPWLREEYQTLRLLSQPEMLATADKLYRVQALAEGSPLPRLMNEGKPVTVFLRVADDLTGWHALGRIKAVRLRIRLTNLDASMNEVRVVLNGHPLPSSILQANDLTFRIINGSPQSPYGYIFEYDLPPEYYLKRGYNAVQVTLIKKDPDIDIPFEIHDVDCSITYRLHRHFEREPMEY